MILLKLLNAFLSFVSIAVCTSICAHGQELAPPIKMVIYPAAEPRPALKHRLLPTYLDRAPGNAAVYLGKVNVETGNLLNSEVIEKYYRWERMPISELLAEQIEMPSTVIDFLDQAACADVCDWQLPIRQGNSYEILLPEVQQQRAFARINAVRIRQHIARREFDEALHALQTGFANARNVAAGQTIVNGLVACSISLNHVTPQVIEFVQQSGAPNLYWALTALPTPLIDFRDAIDVESRAFEFGFPELRDLANAKRTEEEWRDLLHRLATKILSMLADPGQDIRPAVEALDGACRERFMAAKQAMIERGMPADKVAGMNVYQVALLDLTQSHREFMDQAAKYRTLPFSQAQAGMDAAIEKSEMNAELLPPFRQQGLRAIRTTRTLEARIERQITCLRLVEALRMHAAGSGRLPATLDDVKIVPIPNDPVTGQPFSYRLENEKAIISGPPLPNTPSFWEITLSRP